MTEIKASNGKLYVSSIFDCFDSGVTRLEQVVKQAGEYDSILMDIQMPVLNGYDATSAFGDRSGKPIE